MTKNEEKTKLPEIVKERWTQWVALTTTILAVCTAISSMKGGGYSGRIQILNTQEANRWSYYQAKSIKENLSSSAKDNLLAYTMNSTDLKTRQAVEEKIKKYDEKILKYKEEEETIKKEAEALQEEQKECKKHSASFGFAVMWLQIAIMLSSVSALLKKKELWYAGLCFGIAGLVYMLNGYLLFFPA